MQPSSTIPLALLALAAGYALAVPGALLRERYVPSMAPGSSPEEMRSGGGDDRKGALPPPLLRNGAKKLPGVNHKPVVAEQSANRTATTPPPQHPVSGGVFADRCRDLVLLGGSGNKGQSTLQAACRDEDSPGAWWLTSLNLNHCLGNVGGKLVFQERYVVV